jgi:lysophospholipase L1-like esterase
MGRRSLSPEDAMKREQLFGVIAAVICVLVVAVGIEGYVRLFVDKGMQFDLEMFKYARDVKVISPDPLIGHVHGPNRTAHLMGVDVATNSKGLRDREIPYERTPGTLRVVMLGDSGTFGWGVRPEQTYSKLLEGMLAEKGMKAEVVNTGVGNFKTIQEIEYFLTEAYKYNPDLVVLSYSFNDAEILPPHHAPNVFQRNCLSCVFIAGRFDTLLRRFSARPEWSEYYLGLYQDGKGAGWLESKEYFKKLRDYCKEHGIGVLIANIPEIHDVQHYRLQSITDLAHNMADEYGFQFVDSLDWMRTVDSPKLWIAPGDPHPNVLGHQFIAQAIFSKLYPMAQAHQKPQAVKSD